MTEEKRSTMTGEDFETKLRQLVTKETAAVVQSALAIAWDEGFAKGAQIEEDAYWQPGVPPTPANPYRSGEAR